jgi:hypothetical protein
MPGGVLHPAGMGGLPGGEYEGVCQVAYVLAA